METATWQRLAMLGCLLSIIPPLLLVFSGHSEWFLNVCAAIPTFLIGLWFLLFRWKPWKRNGE